VKKPGKSLATLPLILSLIVVVAFGLAVSVLVTRVRMEAASRRVELVIDLDQADLLARSQGYRLDEVLGELEAAGLGAVAWSEATLDKLSRSGDLSVFEGRDLLDLFASGTSPAPELSTLGREGFFDSGYTYAFTRDPLLASWLGRNVPAHLPEGRFRLVERGDLTVLEVTLLKERAVLLNLGFWEREIERSGAARHGLRVVARPGNVTGGKTAVEGTLNDLAVAVERFGFTLSAVVFGGAEALGYPDQLEVTAAGLSELGVPLGLIETPEQLGNINQRGLAAVAERLGHQAVRVYSLPDVRVYAPSELADKATRSVKERGLRLVYIQPYLVVPEHLATVDERTTGGQSVYARPPGLVSNLDYTPILALNVNHVREIAAGLRGQGLELGPPAPLGGPAPLPPLKVLLLGLGPAAALGLAWLALRPRGRLWILAGPVGAAFAAVVLALAVLGGRAVLAAQLGALLAALVFPSLALAYLAASWLLRPAASGRGVAIRRVLADVLGTFAITLVGGLFVGAILGDLRFMLEFEYFRGVKLTYVVPVAAAVVYWARYRYPEDTEPAAWPGVIRALAGKSIKIWHAVVAGLAGLAFIVYVARSGSSVSLPIGSFELRVRWWLERALYARPRLKEILLGYPALLVGSWLAHTGRKDYLGWLLTGAAVGQVSLVNSFEHIRTPLLLSLARAANGLWLGSLAGLGAVALLWVVLGYRRREEGR
jgi:hypothetical protein